MSQYIDADALITAMNTWDWQELYLPILFKQLIDEQPKADVVEVVHGEWIKTTIPEWCGTDELHRSVYRDREIVKCSECGNPSPVYNIEFEFCPRCGAKMDGKK